MASIKTWCPHIHHPTEAGGLIVHEKLGDDAQVVVDRLEPEVVLELRPEEVVVLDVDPDLDLVKQVLPVVPP